MSGSEWVVEAAGCEPDRLRDTGILSALFDSLILDLELHPVMPPLWHQFPAPGGITGMVLLAESHLTVHTFPEHGTLCLNLFCCRPRARWDFEERLRTLLAAKDVEVRFLERPYGENV
jgi:S-adenosylmethionine decarboxylase